MCQILARPFTKIGTLNWTAVSISLKRRTLPALAQGRKSTLPKSYCLCCFTTMRSKSNPSSSGISVNSAQPLQEEFTSGETQPGARSCLPSRALPATIARGTHLITVMPNTSKPRPPEIQSFDGTESGTQSEVLPLFLWVPKERVGGAQFQSCPLPVKQHSRPSPTGLGLDCNREIPRPQHALRVVVTAVQKKCASG